MTETTADDEPDQLSGSELSRERFDWADIRPSTAIIEAIAAVRGVDPADIDPLYDAIDLDAIDTLFRSTSNTTELCVSFTHAEFVVSLEVDGTITISKKAETAASNTDAGDPVTVDT